MTVVTEEYYREITEDETTSTAAVLANLQEAQELIEDFLGRRLELMTRTERMPVWPTGVAYPVAVPIVSVQASSRAEIWDDATLHYVVPDDDRFEFPVTWPGQLVVSGDETIWGGRRATGYEPHYWYATITYEGGWTLDNIPASLRRALISAAQSLLPGSEDSQMPSGASMVRVGDVQISRPKELVTGFLNSVSPGLSNGIRRYYLGRL